ncbi:DNA translocase FtsK [Halobacteriovorax sp. JY17]|uniref:DNA translocase FtsK n=1 Tax=Halobacteriovorax sp. JY17 TaxID=2014617 RepID=UPI000C369208|nr:DNA translocase FtsK [Halobacteriovorax sp. JY17]PIK14568.1 MAG: DNA translocase FtsK [Halobacteriovorax sp. JY17]
MISKILKIQLIGLFFITLIAFYAYYFSDVLPDNFFLISSGSSDVNFFSYYLTTLVALVGYYTGPWIFLPFFFFALLYTFVFSKRESLLDAFNALTLFGTFLFCTYLVYPSFMGAGIFYVLENNFSGMMIFLCTAFCLVGFLAGSFRESFKDSVFSIIDFLKNAPSKVAKASAQISPSEINNRLQNKSEDFVSKVKTKVPLLLKGEAKSDEKPAFAQRMEQAEKPSPSVEVEKEKSSIASFFKKDSGSDDVEDVTPIEKNEEKVSHSVINEDKSAPGGGVVRMASSTSPYKLKNSNAGAPEESQYYSLVKTISKKKDVKRVGHPDDKYFDEITDIIEEKLSEFKIDGLIINVLKGPVVDTFELELGSGIKVSKVTGVTEDLSMALYGAPIRIVYPMKGRTTIGIEVPRNPREIIYLDEVLDSQDFKDSKTMLPVAMGKDAFGDTFVVDLAAMPHMLVAGATGAGKSVFINSLLVSLLVKKSPRQMKLILIDPKQLELAVYSKLPHLVMPVVTDAKTASIALLWAVQEMERRYSILKEFGVRNIAGFNEKLKTAGPAMIAKIHQYYEDSGADEYELPCLVVVVDEFADLILTKAGKEIEMNIARLAAKARAAGVHLVLATQRPSVDVITGVIKSNFPTRVSFRVTSSTDSRTILDKMGAEKLLGKGDMLYKRGVEMTRVHSSFVDEAEIEVLTEELSQLPQDFNENAMEFLENGGEVETDEYTYGSHVVAPDSTSSDDDMYNQALRIVMESRSASASMLQRRLRIGYNRAANLIEEMETKGIVGPAQGSKPRKVLAASDSL